MTQHASPSREPQTSGQSSRIDDQPTQPLPAQPPSSTPPPVSTPPPSGQSPATGHARFVLCMALIIFFVIFLRNSDALQIIGLIATLLSINLLEPIYKSIDRLDKHLGKLEKRFLIFLRDFNDQHFPVLKRHLHPIISFMLAIAMIVLLFHTAIGSLYSSAQDFFCLRMTFLPVPSALSFPPPQRVTVYLKLPPIRTSTGSPLQINSRAEQWHNMSVALSCHQPHLLEWLSLGIVLISTALV